MVTTQVESQPNLNSKSDGCNFRTKVIYTVSYKLAFRYNRSVNQKLTMITRTHRTSAVPFKYTWKLVILTIHERLTHILSRLHKPLRGYVIHYIKYKAPSADTQDAACTTKSSTYRVNYTAVDNRPKFGHTDAQSMRIIAKNHAQCQTHTLRSRTGPRTMANRTQNGKLIARNHVPIVRLPQNRPSLTGGRRNG